MLQANAIIWGETGEGKTLFGVHQVRDYLSRGKRVATNLALQLDELLPPYSRAHYVQLPELPTAEDLDAIGRGSDSPDPKSFGLLLLDEAPSFLDAREWNASGRKAMVEFIRHARKRGWRLGFITQSPDLIDKQVRKSAFPHVIQLRRLDNVTIPFLPFAMPRIHFACIRYGRGQNPMVVGRKFFFGRGLQNAYDTNQEFFESGTGLQSRLSHWHIKGRYMRKWDMYKAAIAVTLLVGMILASIIAYPMGRIHGSQSALATSPEAVNKVEIDKNVKVIGYLMSPGKPTLVTLDDGRTLPAQTYRQDRTGLYFQINQTWIQAK